MTATIELQTRSMQNNLRHRARVTTPTTQRHSFLRQGTAGSAIIATFDSRAGAAQAALDFIACSRPVSLDLLDREALRAVATFVDAGLQWDSEAVLVATIEGELSDIDIATIDKLCRRYDVSGLRICPEPTTAQAAATLVHAARSLAARDQGVPCDIIAPVSQLPRVLKGITAIETRFRVTIGLVAHAGDGIVRPFVVECDAAGHDANVALAALALTFGRDCC